MIIFVFKIIITANMKKTKLILASLVLSFTFISCSTQQRALNDLRSLNEELKENRSRYTASDINRAYNNLSKIQERIKKYEYTKAEYEEIGKLTTSCYIYMGKNAVQTAVGDIINAASQIKGAVDGVKEAAKEIKGEFEKK